MRSLRLALLTIVLGAAVGGAASAQLPVYYGLGEGIEDLGPVPPEVAKDVGEELGLRYVSVGFLYNRFHVYGLDFWTWGGRHVLYEGKTYFAVDEQDWAKVLGDSWKERLRTPIAYRFPPGSVLLGLGLVSVLLKLRFFPSAGQRARRRLKEPRYRAAERAFVSELCSAQERGEVGADVLEHAIQKAAEQLHAEGLHPEEAEREWRELMPHVVLRIRQSPSRAKG